MKKSGWVSYVLITLAVVVYVFLSLNTPSDPVAMQRYNLSQDALFAIRIGFFIPTFLIWFMGAYAFAALSSYLQLVNGTKEERAFRHMRTGLGILFWGGSVIPSLINSIGSYIGHGVSNYPLRPVFVVIGSYLNVWPLLIGFGFILASAKLFLATINVNYRISVKLRVIGGIILAPIAYLCLSLIFSDPYRLLPSPDGIATYYMSDSILILTIIFPLFLAWVIGLAATKKLSVYGHLVQGKVYSRVFSNISFGLNFLIFLSIFLRTLTSIGTSRIASLGFTSIIFLIYLIFLVISIAYLLIARGTGRLAQIETM